MADTIERTIDLDAPIERVWRAIADADEFGAWFGVAISTPFVAGQTASGRITHEGYEHLTWQVEIVAIDAPRLFSFTWHPYAVDPDRDYSAEPPTRVEFRLAPIDTGTRLTIVESGFGALPDDRREEALRMNAGGWDAQMANIARHVGG